MRSLSVDACLNCWLLPLLLATPRAIFVSALDVDSLLDEVQYRVFPRRTVEEAAVLEWGNSAIITALDASVALFGPQTSDAALLEVETAPVIASPLDGLRASGKEGYNDYLKQLNTESPDENEPEPSFEVPVGPLDNADEITGNLCIMTTHEAVSGVELALMAQASGAAALLVVNIQDSSRPDDIFRLTATTVDGDRDERADQIDIPVVMISLNSAQMLATAELDPNSPKSHDLARRAGFSTKYMPERVRLYAGDDRPFFEDVEAAQPTIYLIHDLFKAKECESLIERAIAAGMEPVSGADLLQYTHAPQKYKNVDRVTLWQGLWMTEQAKQIEERMEQVTSFPAAHYSDFIIDRIKVADKKSFIQPHYDELVDGNIPIASMIIFLSDPPTNGGEVIYPNVDSGVPIQIQPRKGMAVIHHNTVQDRGGQAVLDNAAKQGLMPILNENDSDDVFFYVAHKYIFMEPVSTARRVVLPVLALPTRGKLPNFVVQLFDWFVQQFGYEQGSMWFDKGCVFVPVLFILLLAQIVISRVRQELMGGTSNKLSTDEDKKKKRTKKD